MKRIWIWLVVFLVFFFLSLQIPDDPDFGVHLQAGRFILQHKNFPRQDLFSFSLPDQAYVYYSWLGEVILSAVYDSQGFSGKLLPSGLWRVTIVWSFICAIAIFKLFRLSVSSFWLFLVFLLVTSMMFSSIGVRSQMFTFLFSVMEAALLLRWQRKWQVKRAKFQLREALPFVFLFMFWANLHLGFIIGLSIMVFFFSAELLSGLPWKKNIIPKALSSVIICVLSIAATFITPYGIGLYRQAWLISRNPILQKINFEWIPLLSRGFLHLCFAGISLFLLFLIAKQKKINRPLLAVSIFLFLLTLRNVRTAMIFLVFFLPLLSQLLAKIPPLSFKLLPIKGEKIPVYLALTLIPLVIFVRITLNIRQTVSLLNNQQEFAQKGGYPLGAVEFLRLHPDSYQLLNYVDWGGYLAWQLPEKKVFITGIMDTFVSNNRLFLEDYFDIVAAQKSWEKLMDRYGIDSLLLPASLPVVKALKEKSDWKILYEDKESILMRKTCGCGHL